MRERLASRHPVKGEIVLVVAGSPEPAPTSEDPVALYRRLAAEGLTRREAVKQAARRLGRPAREVYAIVQHPRAERWNKLPAAPGVPLRGFRSCRLRLTTLSLRALVSVEFLSVVRRVVVVLQVVEG